MCDVCNRPAAVGYIDSHEKKLCILVYMPDHCTFENKFDIRNRIFCLYYSIKAICKKIGICHVRIPGYPNMRHCDSTILMATHSYEFELAHSLTLYERIRNSLLNLVEL